MYTLCYCQSRMLIFFIAYSKFCTHTSKHICALITLTWHDTNDLWFCVLKQSFSEINTCGKIMNNSFAYTMLKDRTEGVSSYTYLCVTTKLDVFVCVPLHI